MLLPSSLLTLRCFPLSHSPSLSLVPTVAPAKVTIKGPKEARAGDNVTMLCRTARSNPPAEISWVVDGRPINAHNNVTPDAAGGFVTTADITVSITNQVNIFHCLSVQCREKERIDFAPLTDDLHVRECRSRRRSLCTLFAPCFPCLAEPGSPMDQTRIARRFSRCSFTSCTCRATGCTDALARDSVTAAPLEFYSLTSLMLSLSLSIAGSEYENVFLLRREPGSGGNCC